MEDPTQMVDPNEQATPEVMNEELVGEPDTDTQKAKPKPTNKVNGTEEVRLEYSGVTIYLSSCYTDIGQLTNLAWNFFRVLKESNGQTGVSYV